MRTTISLPEGLLRETQRLSGESGLSKAIVTSLSDYVALRKRLALLEALFARPVPHSARRIKKDRRRRQWSS